MRRFIYILTTLFLAAQVGAEAENGKRMAVVELSAIYMRQMPDYESALETQELMGTVVEIVGEQGYWREIVSPQPYRAWATEKGLVEMSEAELKAYLDAPKVIFIGLYGHIYKEPSYRAATLCDLVGGDILRLAAQQPGRASVISSGKGPEAYEKAEGRKHEIRLRGRWTEVMLPSGRKGYVPTKELKPHEGFMSIAQGEGSAASISEETTETIIAEAEKLLGVPYLWGGMSAKGVDCSGLVRISHIMNGVLLPRNASQQIKCGEQIAMDSDIRYWNDDYRMGSRPDEFKKEMQNRIKNLERGDLVFFGSPASEDKPLRITHVGIYIGNNKIIHSSHMVRINSLLPDDSDYYENAHRLIGAIRL
ncbi:MAG: C40 family peptidase [Bacteroidales bacterium]|nr:C40 family peptidase [Bacteroidales bacterium]